jgi:hypothetical protein
MWHPGVARAALETEPCLCSVWIMSPRSLHSARQLWVLNEHCLMTKEGETAKGKTHRPNAGPSICAV